MHICSFQQAAVCGQVRNQILRPWVGQEFLQLLAIIEDLSELLWIVQKIAQKLLVFLDQASRLEHCGQGAARKTIAVRKYEADDHQQRAQRQPGAARCAETVAAPREPDQNQNRKRDQWRRSPPLRGRSVWFRSRPDQKRQGHEASQGHRRGEVRAVPVGALHPVPLQAEANVVQSRGEDQQRADVNGEYGEGPSPVDSPCDQRTNTDGECEPYAVDVDLGVDSREGVSSQPTEQEIQRITKKDVLRLPVQSCPPTHSGVDAAVASPAPSATVRLGTRNEPTAASTEPSDERNLR